MFKYSKNRRSYTPVVQTVVLVDSNIPVAPVVVVDDFVALCVEVGRVEAVSATGVLVGQAELELVLSEEYAEQGRAVAVGLDGHLGVEVEKVNAGHRADPPIKRRKQPVHQVHLVYVRV